MFGKTKSNDKPFMRPLWSLALRSQAQIEVSYCVGNGLSVGVESARGFVSDALRRGLTPEGPAWKAALNWFFRAGRQRSAPQPEGVPTLGHADTGKVP
jgi:hypothetical protein